MKSFLASVVIAAFFLSASGCSTYKVTSYDKDGNVTAEEEVFGTEHTGHGKSKVEFKKSDDAQIVARAEAIKDLGSQEVEGASVTENLLFKLLLSRDIQSLQSQEYGEAAPGSLGGVVGSMFDAAAGAALGGLGIVEGANVLGKLSDKVGPEQTVYGGGQAQQGGVRKETPIVVSPETEAGPESEE